MTQLVLDATLAGKLKALTSPTDLCDPSGRVLGRVVPAVDLSDWEPVSDPISDEELQRRLRSNEKRYTTAEVLEHLEKL